LLWACLFAGLLSSGGGCTAKPDSNLQAMSFNADYGRAREYCATQLLSPNGKKSDPADRQYILDRMRFAISAIADGYREDDAVFTEIYEKLSTQGINKGKEGAAVLINEDVKQWKGEPFEQALMLSYLGMFYASQGSWDNARAAVNASQFRLKDFGGGKHKSTEEVVTEAAKADANKNADSFNNYQERQTDFALGILLDAIANRQIGRGEEAASKFNAVASFRPDLKDLIDELAKSDYDEVLIVSWGAGPQKIGTGPDQSIASWKQLTRSSDDRLIVHVGGSATAARAFPVVTDVNDMAENHMWNNLQDMRKAKSIVGSVLVGAGAGVAAYGASQHDSTTALVGLGVALAGAGLKAGAHADTRYCDVMPQRFYIVPLKRGRGDERVDVEVEHHLASHMSIAALPPRPKTQQQANLRYVSLFSGGSSAPAWAQSGNVLYNNDSLPTNVERPYPYILGGDCVRKPSVAARDYYHKNGYLNGMTVAELESLYREEGIVFDGPEILRTRHVLEGGKCLESPLAGSAGFARLFGQRHPAYVPKSPRVRDLASQIKSSGGERPSVATANP
jgi:hypothetical protein